MGWLFTQGASKQDVIKDCLSQSDMNVLAHAVHGNELWVVFQPKKGTEPFICLFLLAADRAYGWGYKDMDESVGPSYYKCPLKFLGMAPAPKSTYAEGWREKVRQYHAKQADKAKLRKSLAYGMTIRFKDGITACGMPLTTGRIRSVKPLYIELGEGRVVRAKASHIKEVIS